jgi:hypothetical protein
MDGSGCNLLKTATTCYKCNDRQIFPASNALSGQFNESYVMDSGLKAYCQILCLVQWMSPPRTAIGIKKLSSVSPRFPVPVSFRKLDSGSNGEYPGNRGLPRATLSLSGLSKQETSQFFCSLHTGLTTVTVPLVCLEASISRPTGVLPDPSLMEHVYRG